VHDDELPTSWQDAAKTYNEHTGSVPREAMWDAIQRTRTGVVGSVPARLERARPRYVRHVQWAAAAAVLLMIGYGAGVLVSRPAVEAPVTVDARGGVSTDTDAVPVAYDVFARRHFSRAEAILTSFRLNVSRGEEAAAADTALVRWSRTLLRDTRLLLDSPAAEDPRRRALLRELEMILVQIGRVLKTPTDDDLRSTANALSDSHLLSKLRLAAPPGRAPRVQGS
jgi:hypothetical protein